MRVKKGFTLVELLAVTAILSLLALVAYPKVIGMFKSTKKNAFMHEAQNIYNTATGQSMVGQIDGEEVSTYSDTGNKLDLSNAEDIKYYVEVANGKVTTFQVSTDEFSINKTGTTVNINDITLNDIKGKGEEGYISEVGPQIMYLYNEGQYQENWEPGTNNNGQSNSDGTVSVTTSYESDHLLLNLSSPSDYIIPYGGWISKNKIDLTSISKIYFEFENSNNVDTIYLIISSVKNGSSDLYAYFHGYDSYNHKVVNYLNVSSATGEKYVSLRATTPPPTGGIGILKIYRIWVE